MIHLMEGLTSHPRLCAFTALAFLLRTQCCAGQTNVVGPSQPIVATVGDDVLLPCQLEPARDASDMTVEWSNQHLDPRFVHVWRDGVELERKKHPSYKGRTSLSVHKLKLGDVSLKLSRVSLSDGGTYRCFIPTLGRESIVELVVGAVSFIVITLARPEEEEASSRGVVLQCESAGWYPEPEVSWLDAEGHLLSAGPAETVRGPGGLYTVSSRVTVWEGRGNSFTCRVQQRKSNQIREAQIHIRDDVLTACCRSWVHVTIFLSVGFLFTVAVCLLVWKLRRNKMKVTKAKDVNEETAKLDENSEKEAAVVALLVDRKKELEDLRVKLRSQLEEVARESSEKTTLSSANTSRFYVLCMDAEKTRELERRKEELEECLKDAEERLQTVAEVIAKMAAGHEGRRQTDEAQGNSRC